MKRCPECRRDYYDDTLLYCLDDGNALLEGPAAALPSDEPLTAILPVFAAVPSGSRSGEALTTLFRDTDDAATVNSNSIAVLSFANISAEAENEYFCDGLADELLNALAKIDDLKVAARTSAFSFKGKDTNVGEIGKKLGVKTVLEGSVRKSGNRLRISVQLINVSDGYHLWSERYDREMQDIFDVQDEITLAVVAALKIKLLGTEKAEVIKRHTENTQAYKAYLKGRYLRHTKNDHGGALRAFEEAVRLDSAHAPSWIGVAEGSMMAAHYGIIPVRGACRNANAALATAREIQGESADALYVEGFTAFIQRDWLASDRAYRRAIELNPTHTHALGSFGLIQSVRGNLDEALIFFERARESDPLAAFPYAITGAGLVAAGCPGDSLSFFEQAFTFEKENTLALWGFCVANIALGNYAEGIAAAESGVMVSRRGGFFLGLLGWALAVSGRKEDAEATLVELRSRPVTEPCTVSEAWLLAALGDNEGAFDLLRQAEEQDQAFLCYLGLFSFETLRDDPRLKELARRLGVPE